MKLTVGNVSTSKVDRYRDNFDVTTNNKYSTYLLFIIILALLFRYLLSIVLKQNSNKTFCFCCRCWWTHPYISNYNIIHYIFPSPHTHYFELRTTSLSLPATCLGITGPGLRSPAWQPWSIRDMDMLRSDLLRLVRGTAAGGIWRSMSRDTGNQNPVNWLLTLLSFWF